LSNDIQVIAYSFDHHYTKSTCRRVLTPDELENVNDLVSIVGELIKRTPPFRRPEIIKYIQRDMYQAIYTPAIFGVGTLNNATGFPEGGTAWAIGAGTIKNSFIFFFDQKLTLGINMIMVGKQLIYLTISQKILQE